MMSLGVMGVLLSHVISHSRLWQVILPEIVAIGAARLCFIGTVSCMVARSDHRLDPKTLVGPCRVQRRLWQLDGASGVGRQLRPLGGGQARAVAGVFPGTNDVSRGHRWSSCSV